MNSQYFQVSQNTIIYYKTQILGQLNDENYFGLLENEKMTKESCPVKIPNENR